MKGLRQKQHKPLTELMFAVSISLQRHRFPADVIRHAL